MRDPAAAKTWQMAFGRDFGGMAQGDSKTGQKGTNMMFVMMLNVTNHVLRQGQKILMAILLSTTNPIKMSHIVSG